MSNIIDPTAVIDPRVTFGSYNKIGKNVEIKFLNPNSKATVVFGDNNIINDRVRILISEGNLSIGDWNVFHNDMLVMGGAGLTVGHNGWFGQNTILDGSGELVLGNGVRIGMYSQVWTHVASGELIEGCTLHGFRKTIIEDDVWLVGSCIVSSGITIAQRTVALIGSNLTKDTKAHTVYAGSPALEKPNLNFYKPVTIDDKFIMMENWAKEFCAMHNYRIITSVQKIEIIDEKSLETLIISLNLDPKGFNQKTTYYDLLLKKYTKRLTALESAFYRYLFNNKARFIPFNI